MQTPVVIGMQRSASRVTWQILRYLIDETKRPTSWEIPLDGADLIVGNITWPIRVHDYISKIPVIYTYRHPVEAFLSLKSKFMLDVGKKNVLEGGYNSQHAWHDAMNNIGEQWNTFKQLRKDAKDGRDILFLKYEDYYDDHKIRIKTIAEFLNKELAEEDLLEIAEKTSLIENYKSGLRMKHHYGDQSFGNLCGEESGMQQEHVSPQTMGRPGAWFKVQPALLTAVRAGSQPAFEALKEMCEDMEYSL
jgi:hypothetical protein